MKFIDLLPILRENIVFSVHDLKILDKNYDTSKTLRWAKKWYILPIIRWYYTLPEYKTTDIKQSIANKIYSPSYISLETVLHRYGIIPEYPFTTTSVSTKKTAHFDTDFGSYSYQTIKPELFWWYDISHAGKQKILIASLEKAIIDFLYLKTEYKDIDDFRWLRWNREELKNQLDLGILQKYAEILASWVVSKKINILINYIEKW